MIKPDHYKENTAKLPDEEIQNARNYHGEKELVRSMILLAFDARARKEQLAKYPLEKRLEDSHGRGAGFDEVVTAQFWMGRSSSAMTVYCSIWVRCRDGRLFTGKGTAGGYGYHKLSAALEQAIKSAGIELGSPHFGGAGDGAMRHAITATGRAAGYSRLPMHLLDQ